MAAIDFSQFHELAEQFKGEIPLSPASDATPPTPARGGGRPLGDDDLP